MTNPSRNSGHVLGKSSKQRGNMRPRTISNGSNVVKAVLFDIDGVLLDSFRAGYQFFTDVLKTMGYRKPAQSLYRDVFHLPLIPALKHLTKSELTEELERIHEVVGGVRYHTELLEEFPYTKEMLKILHRRYKLGIITSRNIDGLNERYYPFAKTKKYFSIAITRDDVTHPKPHPEPLLLAAKRLKVKPSECVYIGDSHSDIDAGKAAGMKTVLYGGRKNKGADLRTSSFKNLPALIEKL